MTAVTILGSDGTTVLSQTEVDDDEPSVADQAAALAVSMVGVGPDFLAVLATVAPNNTAKPPLDRIGDAFAQALEG